ncbi:MAG: 5-formyltetrahydrofolate cyclo-ligase [Amycolatopsis sp.]|uniref:5-formyltetrahydrofolate cyclo-ligase n=1 Tax=Amycolatopsis sp. TaxID=37632 RepID=UPI0026041CA5|nr:5-formyltetrahydrofolate cyclo-ligase [Amycolatopsis sp.]MCU1679931.1 5-formyltetrahydrofolate cyclo-ligase [Amycolatopsis sp.]
MHGPGNELPSKTEWRARVAAERASVTAGQRQREAFALAATVAELVGRTVCAYLPFGTEPGSVATLDALVARGSVVLLPVIPSAPGPLDWATYQGASSLVAGRLRGVSEPDGPRLGVDAISSAELILVPALAVDRSGGRLGRGAGFYDRTLILAAPSAARIALVRDSELVDELPTEAHDVRMTGAVTPSGGFVDLSIR